MLVSVKAALRDGWFRLRLRRLGCGRGEVERWSSEWRAMTSNRAPGVGCCRLVDGRLRG